MMTVDRSLDTLGLVLLIPGVLSADGFTLTTMLGALEGSSLTIKGIIDGNDVLLEIFVLEIVTESFSFLIEGFDDGITDGTSV